MRTSRSVFYWDIFHTVLLNLVFCLLFENFDLGARTLLLRFAEMLPYTRNRSLGLSCKPLYPPGAEEQYRREDPAPSHVPERAVPYVRRELISLLSFVR